MSPRASFTQQQESAARHVREHLTDPEDRVIGVTGSIPARAEQGRLVQEALPTMELLTVAAVVLLVGLNFRSPVAPVLALAAAGLAFLITIRVAGGRLRTGPESTRAITAAGFTLAVSFALLAVVPLRPFRELGFAMGAGILLDAVVVRSFLVPAMLTLAGPVSGWPGRHLGRDRRSDSPDPLPGGQPVPES